MGYSIYWTRTEKKIDEVFVKEVKKWVDFFNKGSISVRGGDGITEPYIELDGICLNGNAELGTDYESFYITNDEDELGEWQFCKTARRPYTMVIRTILMIAEIKGLVKGLSSDGDIDFMTDAEWLAQ